MNRHTIYRPKPTLLLWGILLATGLSAAPIPAIAVENPLLHLTPESVTVPMPFPGHSSSWALNATNPGNTPAEISLVLTHDQEPRLPACEQKDSIDQLLQLTVTVNGQHTANTTLCELHNRTLSLGSLHPQETIVIDSTVSLPNTTGNQFQGASQTLTFTLTATAHTPQKPPLIPGTQPDDGLAFTGHANTPFLFWLLFLTLGVGTYLTITSLMQKRKGKNHDSP
ncbi:hypothetical protein [Lysinibacter sp. HNR]|uniref:hypothetical protein n=1 Tax=Lysinibacter sp. HNR TaxID=3031408 RepID=UPI002435F90E|nr:hypothetical protein [Lysinibacter sp. HNR]WGD37919.1 hypothetical protein FrondiHNR_03115 [Lysinibacter sp. HNR]